jgi:hypothetical protein
MKLGLDPLVQMKTTLSLNSLAKKERVSIEKFFVSLKYLGYC